MIYFMNSKTFFEDYLNNESDRDITKAYYVCVSTHIRRRDANIDNVVCLNKTLYPNSNVLNRGTFEEMRYEYHDQLSEEALVFFAELIKGSIEEGSNVIFLCTKKEWKLKYLKWLAEFIMLEFEYPVYNYKKYIKGCPLLEYDKDKVLKRVKKISEEAQYKLHNEQRKSKNGRKKILADYKSMSKKELKKICIREELYYDGMSKQEMLDILEAFL